MSINNPGPAFSAAKGIAPKVGATLGDTAKAVAKGVTNGVNYSADKVQLGTSTVVAAGATAAAEAVKAAEMRLANAYDANPVTFAKNLAQSALNDIAGAIHQ